jgi:hypothetical protein
MSAAVATTTPTPTSPGCVFEDSDPSTVVADELGTGSREIEPATEPGVSLEYWKATELSPKSCSLCFRPPTIATRRLTRAARPGQAREVAGPKLESN